MGPRVSGPVAYLSSVNSQQANNSGYSRPGCGRRGTQSGRGDPLAETAEGLSPHPAIGEIIDEIISAEGPLTPFATVDFAADSGAMDERAPEPGGQKTYKTANSIRCITAHSTRLR